jgi:hypothetical protein
VISAQIAGSNLSQCSNWVSRLAFAAADESWIAAFLAYVIQFGVGVVVCGLN